MTAAIVGRPKRSRPVERVNYKLDRDIRALLTQLAERQGRNEGAQVEQLVLFYEAARRINAEGGRLSMDTINAKISEIWEALTTQGPDQSSKTDRAAIDPSPSEDLEGGP